MTLPFRIRPLAERDVEQAKDYYEQQQAGLSDRFKNRLEEALERIQAMPKSYGVIAKSVRAKQLRKFPYVIYYRVLAHEIEVLAIVHGSRDSAAWKERI